MKEKQLYFFVKKPRGSFPPFQIVEEKQILMLLTCDVNAGFTLAT